MPKQKDHGPATRKSHRLATATESQTDQATDESSRVNEEPEDVIIVSPEDTEPEEPVHPEQEGTAPEEPASPNEASVDPELNEPVQSTEEDESEQYDSANEDRQDQTVRDLSQTASPAQQQEPSQQPRTMAPDNHEKANQLQAILDRLAQLENENKAERERNAQLEASLRAAEDARSQQPETDDRNHRAVTPMNSAFGGSDFQPTGFAALDAFKSYGKDQNAVNPKYNENKKQVGLNPGVFSGDKEEYDDWITDVADYIRRNDRTYETERDRMSTLRSLTQGYAKGLLSARFRSTETPFSGTSEMVATLSAVFHDRAQGSKARNELRKLKYNPRDQDMDIHQFIGKINSLADKANIAKSERKAILYEHVPANLNPELFDASEDPGISYETFVVKVANSALAEQRAYEESRELGLKNRKKFEREPSLLDRRPPRRPESRAAQESRPVHRTTDSHDTHEDKQKSDDWKSNNCFLCHKPGHMARDCPERAAIAALLAECDKEDQARRSDALSDDAAASSESEN